MRKEIEQIAFIKDSARWLVITKYGANRFYAEENAKKVAIELDGELFELFGLGGIERVDRPFSNEIENA